jgi:type I restriction enzyme S subunit
MKFNASKFNQHWEDKILDDLGKFNRGKSRHRPRNDPALFADGKYPLVQTGEIKAASLYINSHTETYNDFGLSQSKLWPKDTLCITIAANIAETALLGYPMCFPDSVVGFNAYPNESSELFMHYVFTYIRRAIQNSASGSIQDNINVEYLTGLKFKIPVKDYQDKIVAVLSALDNKIDLNNRINAELEAMAKTLYDYWFVQFDFPDANGKPYKSSGGKMEYNPTLKRHIPAGWECKAIPDLLTIRTGKEDANFASEKGIYPFFTCGEEMLYCDVAVFSGKAILLAGNGNFAVRVYDGEFNAYQRTYVLIPENEHYYSVVYYAVRDKIKTLTKGSRGSIIKFITKGDIEDINLALPEEGQLHNCFEMLNNVAEKISINNKENQQLIQLRDWLLPMLMNGQVKISTK